MTGTGYIPMADRVQLSIMTKSGGWAPEGVTEVTSEKTALEERRAWDSGNVRCVTNMGDEAQDDDGSGEGATLSQVPERP